MYHFVAFSWSSDSGRAAVEALRLSTKLEESKGPWDLVCRCDTLRIYSRQPLDPAMRVYGIPAGGGAIFGRLFRFESPDIPVDPSGLDAENLASDGGRSLLNSYWGGYLAVLRSLRRATVLVIRDCSGRIPCYHVDLPGVYVFFSDIRDVEPLGLRFTINPRYLAAYILHHPLHVVETGLKEVSQVLAGDSVSISRGRVVHERLWDPRLIASTGIIDDYEQGKSQLVSATETVTRLWASLYDRILLMLSGGFDSAVVLGCLKRMQLADRVVCANEYTEGTEDDERSYARAAAKMANVRLLELPRMSDARLFIERLRTVPPSPSPDLHKAVETAAIDNVMQTACELDCDTVWTGEGGDHIFLQIRSAYPAVDYLMRHRLPHHLPKILYESSVLSRQSLWSVIAQSLCYSWVPSTAPPDHCDTRGATIMTKAAAAAISDTYILSHWHVGPGRIPPGKQGQIDILADLLNRHKPFGSLERPYACHPLISQPLIDLALRLPTYHLLRGGRQRAMARAAFADRVPYCILHREDKGGTINHARVLLTGSGPSLREMLLDGTLVTLGIVDRASLERIFVDQDMFRPNDVFPIFACIAIEAWARHWTNRTGLVANVSTGVGDAALPRS